MKKILIISYYWPPAGGIAVQRWLKFVKYLPSYGWNPVLVIPENPSYPIIQEDYLKDIPEGIEYLKVPIRELGRARTPKGGKEIQISMITTHEKTWKDRLKAWVRGNIIIPDARVLWIRPVVKAVSQYLKDNPVDVMVTNGPPHSLHLAGLRIKKRHPELKWLADFRDPWTRINYYEELKPGWLADTLQKHWERKVVRTADMVTTVSESWANDYREMGAKVQVISNGYDHEEYLLSPDKILSMDSDFTLTYVGNFMADQNYEILWQAIKEIKDENAEFNEKFRLNLVGFVDYSIKLKIQEYELENTTSFKGYLPQKEAIKLQQSAQLLLLLIVKSGNPMGMITGKVFGYLASARPILLIGPENGDAAKLIESTHSGLFFGADKKDALKAALLKYFQAFQQGKINFTGDPIKIQNLSRKNLCGNLSDQLNELSGK